MQENVLTVHINKPVNIAFIFAITPPNSTLWIPGIVEEKTSEWPVQVGTSYKLKNNAGEWSEVIVEQIKQNRIVEWVTNNRNFHCKYSFKMVSPTSSELEYREWVNQGTLEEPFTQEILDGLKAAIENA
jgi:hypothetical protein